MIVPMKKAAVLVQAKDAEGALQALRSLGVLHVAHQNPPAGKDIASIKDDIATLDKVITILSSPEFIGKSGAGGVRLLTDWRFTAKHVLDTFARIDHLGEYSRTLSGRVAEWSEWGDFEPAKLAALAQQGIHIRLCQIPVKELETVPAHIVVRKISGSKTMANCALVSRQAIDVPYKDLGLPRMGLAEMRVRLTEDGDIVAGLKDMLRKCTCYLGRFQEIRKAFAKELEFHEALRGMGASGGIAYIVGYVPNDTIALLEKKAAAEQWALSITDPAPDDPVPTLIRNPAWISLINPVYRLLEIIPGYKELDISPLFLMFLSLFFGMIIGDAGYGAIYMALTFFAQRKFGRKHKDQRVYFLLYLFSSTAILWGVLTGTVFGQEWYLKAGFKAALPVLNNTKFLQAFCFFLGAFHLTLAHAWQAVRKLPSPTALADIGWIWVLWAAFFLARMLILDYALPPCTKYLIIGGITLVIIGTSPQRNIFRMAGEGLGAVALSIMNNFTDVVSYVRLFAVGLAGVAISDTVNSLAGGFAGNPVAHFLILFAGHTINIVLGPMSVLVHGIRLNVLEFSGHAGLSWNGTAYKPLEK